MTVAHNFRYIIVDSDGVTGTNDASIARRHINDETTVIDTRDCVVLQPASCDGGDAVDLPIHEQKLMV